MPGQGPIFAAAILILMILEVGVKTLIQNPDSLYLFLQRKDPLPDGNGIRWDIPGGRIKSDEGLATALARELREEIGFAIRNSPKLLEAQDIFIPDGSRHIVRLTYLVRADGNVSLSSEHQHFVWKSLRDAQTLKTDPYLSKLLVELT